MLYIYYMFIIIGKNLKKYFITGCFLSMIPVALGLVLNFGHTSRNASFFNNPNQLGFFVILMSTALFLFDYSIPTIQYIFIAVVSCVGVLLSGSKAAVLGLIVLYAVMLKRISWTA